MKNIHGIETDNIKVGDRVLVKGCAKDREEAHWGTVLSNSSYGEYIYVAMDDKTLTDSLQYPGSTEHGSYMAYEHEVVQHYSSGEATTTLPDTVEAPQTALEALNTKLVDSVRYLEHMTGKKYEPTISGFELSHFSEYDNNSVVISFKEVKEH